MELDMNIQSLIGLNSKRLELVNFLLSDCKKAEYARRMISNLIESSSFAYAGTVTEFDGCIEYSDIIVKSNDSEELHRIAEKLQKMRDDVILCSYDNHYVMPTYENDVQLLKRGN